MPHSTGEQNFNNAKNYENDEMEEIGLLLLKCDLWQIGLTWPLNFLGDGTWWCRVPDGTKPMILLKGSYRSQWDRQNIFEGYISKWQPLFIGTNVLS